jgi:hypothetical protein
MKLRLSLCWKSTDLRIFENKVLRKYLHIRKKNYQEDVKVM